MATNHISQLKNPHVEQLEEDDIDDSNPKKFLQSLEEVREVKIPWFTNVVNYLVAKILLKGHYYADKVAPKILESGFYWLTLFKHA